MTQLHIAGNVVDQNQIPVVGAQIFVRAGGINASLQNASGGPVANPLISGADGFFEAYSTSSGTHTLEYYWGGKLRRIDTVSEIDRLQAIADSSAASALAAAAFSGPFYTSTAEGLAATSSGDEFLVRPKADDPTADIYLNNAGAAVFARTIIIAPSASGTSGELGHIASGSGAVATTVQAKMREIVSVKDFGATGDGTTDDTSAIQAALNSLANGGVVTVPTGAYKVNSNLSIPNGVTLDGGIRNPDPARAGLTPVLTRTPRIALASSATITLNNSSAIIGLYIQRQGLATGEDPTTWAGTAITVKGAGTYQGDLLVAGFSRWCNATSASDGERCARLRAERVLFDCRNGIVIEQCFDIPYLLECHGNDLTAASTTLRDGVGFQFSNSVDWGRATNCFTYGYAVGFRIDDADDCILTNCGADYAPSGTSTAIGFDISGTSRTTKLIGCQSAATGTAVKVDVGTSTYPHVQIIGGSFWDIDTAGVSLLSGSVSIMGCNFGGGGQTAIVAADTTDAVSITATGNTFDDPTAVFSIPNAATINKSTIHSNTFIDCTDATVGEMHSYEAGQRDLITMRSANSTNVGARFTFDKARGTLASPTVPSASDTTISLFGRGWTGSTWGNSAQIRAQFEGSPSGTSTAGRIVFSTTPSGSTTLADRMTITAAGGVVLSALPTYVDNAAAVSGGLATNSLYKTSGGEVRIVV